MLMRREDIAQVGTIKDVFECREDLDPDRWSIFARDESAKVVNFLSHERNTKEYLLAGVKEYEPGEYRQRREEELSCDGQNQGSHEQCSHDRLEERTRSLNNAEGEDAQEGKE